MKAHRWLTLTAAGLLAAFEVLTFAGSSTANATSPAPSDMRLSVAADAPADSDDIRSVTIVTTPSRLEAESNAHLSLAGLGSLYWAARNPAQGWKVLLPVEPGTVAYEDIRARCAIFTNAPRGRAACP